MITIYEDSDPYEPAECLGVFEDEDLFLQQKVVHSDHFKKFFYRLVTQEENGSTIWVNIENSNDIRRINPGNFPPSCRVEDFKINHLYGE